MTLCFGDKERKPRASDWTDEQMDTLRAMAGKLPAAEIAAALGCDVRRVQCKAQKLGLSLAVRTYRQWMPQEIATMRRMAPTHTIAEVAAHLGRTERATIWAAGKYGVAFRKHGEAHHTNKYPTATIERIHQLRAQGWGQRRIARAAGMDNKHVWLIINYGARWREYMALDAREESHA